LISWNSVTCGQDAYTTAGETLALQIENEESLKKLQKFSKEELTSPIGLLL